MKLLTEIPYTSDSAGYFEPLADRPWAVFLDSGRTRLAGGRYDILAAEPYCTLVTRGNLTEVRTRGDVQLSQDDPLDLLRQQLGSPSERVNGLPFSGGALGWFAYDLGRRLERLPVMAVDVEHAPEMAVGIYDWALVVDHQEQRAWLTGQGRDPGTRIRWAQLEALFREPQPCRHPAPFRLLGPVCSNMSKAEYAACFARIKEYILNGDCYQVNFAQRFSARAEGDAWSAYKTLRGLNPAPFSAFVSTPYARVLSSSPERFLRVRDGRVETKPIKGTRPRGDTPHGDLALARELAASPKDLAENLMIVDLLRNDISRVCAAGSVGVPKLFDVESYATVHHLVSTVSGRLDQGEDAVSLLRACFPGGSITGAPKIRAMEIIEELEPERRGVYCGAIGYLGFDGSMDTSIAIRTLVHNHGSIRFWAGGGIVHDSTMEAEYQETFHKTSALLRLLESEPVAHLGA